MATPRNLSDLQALLAVNTSGAIGAQDVLDFLISVFPHTTKGDIALLAATGILGRLGIGANNTILVAASGETLGVKWTDALTLAGALVANGGVVFNEPGEDKDFRVESNSLDDALFVQGSSGFVGFGTSSPNVPIDVERATTAQFRIRNTGNNDVQLVFGSVRTAQFQTIASLEGRWDGTTIGKIQFSAGADTINKDEGYFSLNTKVANVQEEVARFGTSTSYNVTINETGKDHDFRVEGLVLQNLIKVDAGLDRVGIATAAPIRLFDVNQGGGNMIADGYDTHSLLQYKEDAAEVPADGSAGLIDTLKNVPLFDFKRLPFVSSDELMKAAIEEFDLFPDIENRPATAGEPAEMVPVDHPDSREYMTTAPKPIKDWMDAKRTELRDTRRLQPEWQRRHLGLVADNPATVDAVPDIISRNDDGAISGYSLNSYVGLLHGALREAIARIEVLETRRPA